MTGRPGQNNHIHGCNKFMFFSKKIKSFRYENLQIQPNLSANYTQFASFYLIQIFIYQISIKIWRNKCILTLILPNLNRDLVNKCLNKIERSKLRIIGRKIWMDVIVFFIENVDVSIDENINKIIDKLQKSILITHYGRQPSDLSFSLFTQQESSIVKDFLL
jgi:hypothetical protein